MVKLGDFGIARVLNATQELAKTACGTPYYMSPEICDNKPYNDKSDVWSMGCVLQEMCTLRRTFDGSIMSVTNAVVTGLRDPMPESYSDELRRTVDVCLSLDPLERPSAAAVNAALQPSGHVTEKVEQMLCSMLVLRAGENSQLAQHLSP